MNEDIRVVVPFDHSYAVQEEVQPLQQNEQIPDIEVVEQLDFPPAAAQAEPRRANNARTRRQRREVMCDSHGYTYCMNRIVRNVKYLRCSRYNKGCHGRAISRDGIIESQGNHLHNHAVDERRVAIRKFTSEMIREAGDRGLQGRNMMELYHSVAERFPSEAEYTTYSTARRAVVRFHGNLQPRIPDSLQDLAESLSSGDHRIYQNIHGGQTAFFQAIVGEENNTSLIFSNREFLSCLGDGVEEVHMDGTFQVVPQHPRCAQLFVIHGMKHNMSFPLVYVLMSRKTQNSYNLVLRYVWDHLFSTFQTQPRIVMIDFETALRNSVRELNENIIISGCWFHYCQSIWRTSVKLGLHRLLQNQEAKKVVKMLMALAHFPANIVEGEYMPPYTIVDGLSEIENYCVQQNLHNEFRRLLNYMKNFWIIRVGPENFSVYNNGRRTNNDVEAFHSTLIGKFTGHRHPNINVFLESLQKIERNTELEFRQAERGELVRRNNPLRSQHNDALIRRCMTGLAARRQPLIEVLKTMAHTVGTFVEDRIHIVEHLPNNRIEAPEENDEDLFLPVVLPAQEDRLLHDNRQIMPRGQRRGRGRMGVGRQVLRPVVAGPQRRGQREDFRAVVRGEWIPHNFEDQRQTLLNVIVDCEDQEAEGMDPRCVCCIMNKVVFMCTPCNHLCMCGNCVQIHRLGQGNGRLIGCPSCRQPINNYIRVFIA